MAIKRRTKINKDHKDAVAARARVPDIIDEVPPTELVAAIKRAASLRGMILGYIAEEKFEELVLRKMSGVSDIQKHDDHDRSVNKSDRDLVYKGRRFSIQLKSIQTNSIAFRTDEERLVATVQNDGSDRRTVKLPNGHSIETTNYRIGDYDILAVPLFPFTGDWSFAYKRNKDCRLTESNKYKPEDRKYLLATTEIITYPLDDGWTLDLRSLLVAPVGEALRVARVADEDLDR
jgi:hypothetical protein